MPAFKLGDTVKVRKTPKGLPFRPTTAAVREFIFVGEGTIVSMFPDKHKSGFILGVQLPSRNFALIH